MNKFVFIKGELKTHEVRHILHEISMMNPSEEIRPIPHTKFCIISRKGKNYVGSNESLREIVND